MRIDSNQVINVNMIYDHWESETSECLPQLHSVTGNDICHKIYYWKGPCFQNVCKDPSNLTNCLKKKNIC